MNRVGAWDRMMVIVGEVVGSVLGLVLGFGCEVGRAGVGAGARG